ncbi:MAG: sulfatase-like hydrolase/transferase [Chloroflexota bacterium]
MPERPNILFILTDQQRLDSMRCYGNTWIETPNLDALADRSFVFENPYVTQPVCTPARSSIMTGLYPHTTGQVRNNIPMRPDTRTIAEMAPAGYHCAYYGKWHLGNDSQPQHGFTDWLTTSSRHGASNRADKEDNSDYHRFLERNGVVLPELRVRPGGDGAASERAVAQANLPEHLTQAAFVGEETARFLREHAAQRPDQPFIMYTNFFEPHPPYSGPLNGLYDPASLPAGPTFLEKPEGASLFNQSRADFYLQSEHRADSVAGCDGHDLGTEAGWRALRAQYFGNVTLVDRAVGNILNALEESGQADNTVVVFTSEHGDMLGDHGMLEKRSFYEEASRVPLLVHVPWLSKEEKRVPGSISQVDLVPTLLELIGADIPPHLQGRSRAGVLRGEDSLDDGVFIEWNGHGDRDLGNPTVNRMIALPRRSVISEDRWKLNLCAGDIGELFDLNNDPHEQHNLFYETSYRDRVVDMSARIRLWQMDTGDTAPLPGV